MCVVCVCACVRVCVVASSAVVSILDTLLFLSHVSHVCVCHVCVWLVFGLQIMVEETLRISDSRVRYVLSDLCACVCVCACVWYVCVCVCCVCVLFAMYVCVVCVRVCVCTRM